MKKLTIAAGIALTISALVPPLLAQSPPRYVFVANSSVNTVTLIDPLTTTVAGTVAVAAMPWRVVVSADGATAYVSHPTLGSVSVVDVATRTVTASIATGAGQGAIAISPNGQKLLVATNGMIKVISLPSGAEVASIATVGTATDLAFLPDGNRAYATIGYLWAIDVAGGVATRTSVLAGALAIMPSGNTLYVGTGTGIEEIDTTTHMPLRTLAMGGTTGPLAVTPDGSRLYAGVQGFTLVSSTYGEFSVAFRHVGVVETAYNTRIATITTSAPVARMAVTPNRADVYMTMPSTSVLVASVNTNTVRRTLAVGSGVQGVAISPDPSGVIVPYLIDAVNDTTTALTTSDIGGRPIPNVLVNDRLGGVGATLSNVTLSEVSSTGSGVRLDVSTGAIVVDPGAAAGAHAVVYQICETASPANCDQATASLTVRMPYVIDAVDDSATANPGKVALMALSNDTLNAAPATTANVRVTQVSTTHPSVNISTAGAVNVLAGTPSGAYTLVYRICEIAVPGNCDTATVSLQVVPTFIDAVDDAGTVTPAGGVAVANVLVNDKLGTGAATVANVRIAQVSAAAGLTLNTATGAVTVAANSPAGSKALVYSICETANPANCDTATVSIEVTPWLIDAVNDIGNATRSGGIALASVLTNDRLGPNAATVSNVRITVESAAAGISLNTANGAVSVVAGTAVGVHSLVYRICEIISPANCDTATVTVTVVAYRIDAVDDYVRASSKSASTLIASVLNNDTLGGARATLSTVTLALVSGPANPLIRLDLTDGSVDLLGKVDSMTYRIVYQICEIANPSNCDQATAVLDLSGGL